MRKLHKLLPAVALAVASAEASAQLLYEPFDYGTASVGTAVGNAGPTTFVGYVNPMNGQFHSVVATNVAPPTGPFTNQATIAAGNLNVPAGFSAASGNSLNYTSSLQSPRLGVTNAPFTQASNETVYYSGILKVTDLTGLASTAGNGGAFIAGFNNSTGTQGTQVTVVGARLQIRRGGVANDSTTLYQLGIRQNAEAIVWDTVNEYTVGVSEPLVVASYQLVSGGTANDLGKLWVNPAASTYGAAAAPLTTNATSNLNDMSANAANNQVASFIWRGDNALVPAGISFDEVRVDTTWAQVTPPTGNTWTGAPAASWSTGANWSAASAPNAVREFVNFANGPGGAVNVDAPQTVGTINIKSTGSYSIGGSVITLDGDAANGGKSAINVIPVMDATGGPPPTDPVLASSHTISSGLVLANGLATNVGKSQNLNLSGVVSGTGPVVKGGAGVTQLSDTANTFTGGTIVHGGFVAISADLSLGPVPGAPATNVTLNRAGLRFDAPMALDVNRNIAMFGSVSTVNPFGGILDTNGNDVTINGIITGLNVNKTGAGVVTFTNAGNSYTNTVISGGGVLAGSNAVLGLGSITFDGGGRLIFGNTFNIAGTRGLTVNAGGGGVDTNGFDTVMGANVIGGPGTFTKFGNGQLTLGGSNTYTGGTSVVGGVLNVASDANFGAAGSAIAINGATLRWSGATFDMTGRPINVGAGGATLNIESTTTTNAAGSVSGSGAVIKEGTGTFAAANIRAGDLSVNNGVVRIVPNATAAGVSKVGSIAIATKLDLTDNKLITTSPEGTWNGSSYTGVSGLVDSGRGNASNAQWDGNGIVTTDTRAVNNNDLLSIGTAKVGAIKGIADTATTTFAGQTVLGSDTIAMTTWGGDANLDGKINIDDYGQIDFNVASSGSVFGWYNGDFNYDGKINIDDYGIIDFNVGAQDSIFPTGGGIEGVAAVPEPSAAVCLLVGATLGLLRRRSRRTS